MYLEISKTKDILKFKDQFLNVANPIQHRIQRFEASGEETFGPKMNEHLDPMVINWQKINGLWNEALLALLVQRIEDENFMGKEPFPGDSVVSIFPGRVVRFECIIEIFHNCVPFVQMIPMHLHCSVLFRHHAGLESNDSETIVELSLLNIFFGLAMSGANVGRLSCMDYEIDLEDNAGEIQVKRVDASNMTIQEKVKEKNAIDNECLGRTGQFRLLVQ